jgi:hypothetical protein
MRSRTRRSHHQGARHRKAAKQARRQARKQARRFTRRRKAFTLPAPVLRGPRGNGSRLLVALCGGLAILGVISSSIFPQPPDTKSPAALIGISPAPLCCARRRNRKSDADALCRDVAASYARFSSDQQDAKSIGDQQRPCRERAERDGNHIPDDFQFAGQAVSGTKLKRDGFDRCSKPPRMGGSKRCTFST